MLVCTTQPNEGPETKSKSLQIMIGHEKFIKPNKIDKLLYSFFLNAHRGRELIKKMKTLFVLLNVCQFR